MKKSRGELIQEYIDWYIDGATLSELCEVVATQMWDDLDMLGDTELIEDIKQFAPHIVKDESLEE